MKRYILKLLGIPDFKKEIEDLKTTIDTLNNKATKTYQIYEDAFCFIIGLDIQDKNVPWWEQKDLRFDGNNYEVIRLAENIKRSRQVQFAKSNPSLKIRKIFHGGCLSCQTPLDKGIGTCTGCKYLMDWDYPDLSTRL